MGEVILALLVIALVVVLAVTAPGLHRPDPRPLRQVIEETALKTAEDYLRGPEFAKLVKDSCEANPRWRWLIAMARRFREVDKSMPPETAWNLAVETTREYLKMEGVKFGAAGYAWDAGGARQVADDLEIEHWERRP